MIEKLKELLENAKKVLTSRSTAALFMAAVVLVSVIPGLCAAATERNRQESSYYFVQDTELIRASGKKELLQISGNFLSPSTSSGAREDVAARLSPTVFESADGKYFFYADNSGDDPGSFSLYCRRLRNLSNVMKVDSGITAVLPAEKGAAILYKKGSSLCSFSPDSGAAEISASCGSFAGNRDFSSVAFLDPDSNLFLKTGSGEPQKLDRDVTSVGVVTDRSTVYYVKNQVLYKKAVNKDKEKICSDIFENGFLPETSGEAFYFFTFRDKEINTADLITDDLAEQDAAMSEPIAPIRPARYSFSSDEEFLRALEDYDKACSEFSFAQEEYNQKLERDRLRSSVSIGVLREQTVELNYFNGKKIVPVSDSVMPGSCRLSPAGDALLFSEETVTGYGKVDLSTQISYGGVLASLEKNRQSEVHWYAVRQDGPKTSFQGNPSLITFSDNGKFAYCMENIEGDTGRLLQLRMNRFDTELLSENAFAGNPELLADRIYFTDTVSSGDVTKGTLTVDGKTADTDVWTESVVRRGNRVYYLTDYSAKGYGTLKCWNGRRARKVADDVHAFAVTENGEVAFIRNFDQNTGCGTLFFGRKRAKTVAENAVFVFTPEKK